MANNILEMALELLEHEQKFLPSTLSAWFGDATVVSFTDNRLVLHSPSDFKQKYITDKFIEPLQNALYQLTGEAATVVVVTGEYSTPAQSASPYDGSSSARPTNSLTRRPMRSRSARLRKTTRCSSTATPVWARPI